MPANNEGGEKTEAASPKKREDERKKGNIFMSKDVVTVFTTVIAFYAFRASVGGLINKISLNYAIQMHRITYLNTIENAEVVKIFTEVASIIVTGLLPPMIIAGSAAVLATITQTKMLVSFEQIKFKMSRLSLLNGMKKFFSVRSLVELAKSLIKTVLLAWLLFNNIKGVVAYASSMIDWELEQAVSYAGEEIMALVISVAIAFGVVAAADFLYQRWEYEKGIKMTKQEVKDEYKQMEGNPEIKGARKRKQREFAMQRMMQAIQEADVIVRNPTHYAVALKYALDTDPAPIVLAKGADHVAQKIVEEGEKHGIVTVENPPLARGLYNTADILGYIPAEFFQPVAELLAWIYNAREQGKNPGAPPRLDIAAAE